jgi:hypothetical protein
MPEDRRDQIEPMQPDPVMREGRSGSGWVWIVSGVILVAIIVTFFAVNANHQTAQNQPKANPPITTGAGSGAPQPAQPTGRNTSAAPPSGNQKTVR